MISVNSNTLLGVALDPSGRLAARKDRVDDRVFSYEFAYDAAGRLTRVTRDGVPVEEYAYDAQGRRSEDTSSPRSVLGRLHEFDDLGRLRKAGNVEYTYDHADRLASRANGVRVTRYSYDREGRLKKVRLPNDHVIEYIHDPQGKRVARLRDGEVVERYSWLDFIRLLSVHDGRDREKVRFEYGQGRVPVAMRHKDMMYRIETDQVGSPLALVDRDERVVKRVIYDSFGNTVHDDNPKLKLPLGFAGGLWDKETGLVHFGYRDYDPDVGRFTTKDPIGYAGGDSDLYGYCLDDPVNGVDPWGLESDGAGKRIIISGATGAGWGAIRGASAGAPGMVAGGIAGLTTGLLKGAVLEYPPLREGIDAAKQWAVDTQDANIERLKKARFDDQPVPPLRGDVRWTKDGADGGGDG
jgi:RHS repeat-associated protein